MRFYLNFSLEKKGNVHSLYDKKKGVMQRIKFFEYYIENYF
jgi:hypothetical protein